MADDIVSSVTKVDVDVRARDGARGYPPGPSAPDDDDEELILLLLSFHNCFDILCVCAG